ncbi:glycosyltransferase family 39 protein [bacterium]|nr:glycosyltransferase family 39 protein [bacterium]
MKRNEKIFLWAIILLALFLRIYRVQFGLPWVYWVDEDICTRYGVYIALNGTLNPFTFGYPSMIFYLSAILGTISWAITNIFGGNIDWHTFWLSYFGDATILALTGRFFQAVIGTITVFITYKIGAMFDKRVGFISAITMALSPLAIIESHRFAADGIMTFFCALTVLFTMKYHFKDETKNWVLAAIFAGFAAGTKYLGGIAIVSLWMVELFRQKSFRKFLKSKVLWLSILISLGAFFITTPYLLINPKEMILDLGRDTVHMFGGHLGFEHSAPAFIQNILHFGYALGIAGLLAAVLGSIILFRKNKKLFYILVSFPLIHYLLTALWQVSYARYMFIALPPLAVLSSFGLIEILRRWKILGIILIVLAFGELSIHALLIERYLSLPNSLDIARKWIMENVPEDETIGTMLGNRLFAGSDEQIRSLLQKARAGSSIDTLYYKGVLYYTPARYKRPLFNLPMVGRQTGLMDKLKSFGSKIIGYKRKGEPAKMNPGELLAENDVHYYVASAVYYQRYRNARDIYPLQNEFYDNVLNPQNILASFGGEYKLNFREVPSMSYMFRTKTNGIKTVICRLNRFNLSFVRCFPCQ